jgi:molybdopterin/thiamine biosynthesis adenylyltransferase
VSSSRRGLFRELAAAARDVKAAADAAAPSSEADAAAPVSGRPGLSDSDLERYSRQLVLPEWSERAQLALSDASVLVVGAGALGSPAALYLAGAGVGRLGIADGDVVELSNLHRQHLHFTPDVGVPKAHSAAAKLGFLNPEIVVEPYQVRLDADNAGGLVEGQDLVVDCSDSFATRYAVNAACCAAGTPLVEGGVLGLSGLVMAIRPGDGACYRCAFPEPPADAPSCAEAGVLGPAAGVIGSLMALEAIKLLAGVGEPLRDGFLQADLGSLQFTRVRVERRPGCPDCGPAYS